jgi:hypothetical protein
MVAGTYPERFALTRIGTLPGASYTDAMKPQAISGAVCLTGSKGSVVAWKFGQIEVEDVGKNSEEALHLFVSIVNVSICGNMMICEDVEWR